MKYPSISCALTCAHHHYQKSVAALVAYVLATFTLSSHAAWTGAVFCIRKQPRKSAATMRVDGMPKFATWLIAAAVSFPFSTAFAGTVEFSPTTLAIGINGCVSTNTGPTVGLCPVNAINLLDPEDDTINLFNLDADVNGFEVFDIGGSSDIGSADVLLNDVLVGTLSTGNPIVSAVFSDPSANQVIRIVNTDAVLLNYAFGTTAVPIPAAVWLFGSGLIGLIGVARRKVA